MNRKEATDLVSYGVILSRVTDAGSFRVADTVMRLDRLGTEAKRWAERLCNYGEPKEGADDRKRRSIERRALKALIDASIDPKFCKNLVKVIIEVVGDPRARARDYVQITLIFRDSGGVPINLRF